MDLEALGLAMRVGQARKRDANEAAIIAALRAVGAHVCQVSGKGAPDLICRVPAASWGRLYAFEVKSGSGKRTEAQAVTGWPIIRSVSEALEAVGVR